MAKIVTINGIPVFEAIINDESDGMQKISLVDYPAVKRDFTAFANQKPLQLYKIADEDERRVIGVVMRADFPIYRRDEAMDGEYYIIYKADTIRAMAEKYLLENRQNDVNLMHAENSDVEGVNMVQFFIKGKGCNPEGFEDIADGSLFAEFHVTNDEVWQAIKDGTYKGFSFEGYFSFIPEQDEASIEDIVEGLDGKFSAIIKPFKDIFNFSNMAKIKEFFAALASVLTAAPEDKTLTKMGSTTTDKGVIFWDGDEDLKAGDSVYVEDADGNRVAAEAGDYVTEDGKIIVVVDGKVSEIKDPAAEVAPQEDNEAEKAVSSASLHRLMAVKFGMSFDEKYDAIYKALNALGMEYPWIAEAGDDYAVVEIYNGSSYEHKRFPVTFKEDGTVTLGTPVNVKRIYVPEDFADPFETANSLETTQSELARVKSELEALKKKPAGQPAHVAFKQSSESVMPRGLQNPKGLQNLARFSKKAE